MERSVELSICIPTYNRGHLIGETIESITRQIEKGVEIVVSDNGSTDGTEKVIAPLTEKYPYIRYHRSPVNVGADRNFLRLVELAKGRFCWLLGSDDIIEPGGVRRVLEILSENKDLSGISVNVNAYSSDLSRRVDFTEIGSDRDLFFSDWKSCFKLLFIHLGYLSGHVFKKSLWDEVAREAETMNYLNCFIHLYVISNLIHRHSNWMFCSERCVGYRSGNAFFDTPIDLYKRCAMDLEFVRILDSTSKNIPEVRKPVMRQLISNHMKYHVKTALFQQDDLNQLREIRALLCREFSFHIDFWVHLAPWVFVPRPILRGIRFLKGRLKLLFGTLVGA